MDGVALKTLELLEETFRALSEKLGVALPKVYEILLKQQYVEAVQSLAGAVICFILFGIIIRISSKFWKDEDIDKQSAAVAVAAGCLVLGLLIFITNVLPAIGKIINPDYYILQSIITTLKK